jgi:hypothetical protein
MLLWKPRQPLLVSRRLFLQLFRLHSLDTTYYTVHTDAGEFTKLRANLVFVRRVQPYVQQHYLPTGAFVLSSWAAFYLSPGHVTARLAPCLTALLGVLLYASQSNESLPKVPYGKSLDLWNCVCTLFVLSALIVVVFVNFLFKSYGHHSLSAAKHRRREYLVERIDLRASSLLTVRFSL